MPHALYVLNTTTLCSFRFPQAGIPTTEFSNTYGLMSFGGIPKPGWRAFQLLHQHAGTFRVPVAVTEHPPDPPTPPPVPVAPVCRYAPGINFSANPSAVPHHQDSWATTAATAGDCCDLCRNASNCAFWTWAGHQQQGAISSSGSSGAAAGAGDRQHMEQRTPLAAHANTALIDARASAASCGPGNLSNLTANPSIGSMGHHQPSWFVLTGDAAECCGACVNATDCAAWSFSAVKWGKLPAKRCYLKRSDAVQSPSLDGSMVSGTLRPPAPSPPKPPSPSPPSPSPSPPRPRGDPKCWLKLNNWTHSAATDSSMISGSIDGRPTPLPGPYVLNCVSALATVASIGAPPVVFLAFWDQGGVGNHVDRAVKVSLTRDSGGIWAAAAAAATTVMVYRIDDMHANAVGVYREMGSPAVPTTEQRQQLMSASEVQPVPVPVASDGSVTVVMSPNSAVMLAFV